MFQFRATHVFRPPKHNLFADCGRERRGLLDKEATSHDDLFDAFRLSLQFWY